MTCQKQNAAPTARSRRRKESCVTPVISALVQASRYTDALFESAQEALLVFDADLRVVQANSSFQRMFELGDRTINGRLFCEFDHARWDLEQLRALVKKITPRNSKLDNCEIHLNSVLHEEKYLVVNARRIEPDAEHPLTLLAIEDVTEKKQQMNAVKRQAALLELARDAVLVRNLEGRIQFWNHAAEDLYGWTKQEAVGRFTDDLIRTKFPKPWKEVETHLLKYGYWEGELIHTCKDGTTRIVQSRWAIHWQAGPTVILEINSDITSKKQMDENLRKLSGYLIHLQDEERRRIARELHDSTGQKLILLKMSVESIAARLDLDPRKVPALAESIQLADQATQEIRTISQLLHPPLLDEAGLKVAATSLVDGFSERSGIKVDLHMPEDLARLPEHVEIALYRVLQEALNNIHRHSRASKATIRMAQFRDKTLRLSISDNGRGFQGESPITRGDADPPVGVGLRGMRERLSQLGGSLEISSGKKGTIIVARIPQSIE